MSEESGIWNWESVCRPEIRLQEKSGIRIHFGFGGIGSDGIL